MPARALMIQGSCSHAGKSIMTAGLCRWLVRRGYRVVPFKPQSMSRDSAVTDDDGEIGRSQAVQAMACELAPHSDMNPLLLKPVDDHTYELIVQGKRRDRIALETFQRLKEYINERIMESFGRLSGRYDAIIIEGSGNPSEPHLAQGDIANMGFARVIECPVALVGDIERGGLIAQLVGTVELLSSSDRKLIKGFIVNRFRGDLEALQNGLQWLEQRTGRPVYGVMPYIQDLQLEEQENLPLEAERKSQSVAKLNVVVPALPHMSNDTDFAPLHKHGNVNLYLVEHGSQIPHADLIILPGSRNVRADLQWLRQQHWAQILARHLRYGGKLMGICGGFEMLGQWIHDPDGIEGAPGDTPGFGWLDMQTTLEAANQIGKVTGTLEIDGVHFTGYRIHHGKTSGDALLRPLTRYGDRKDGAISDDNQVIGTHMHGIFEHAEASHALLRWAGLVTSKQLDYSGFREQELDRLADIIDVQLDTDALLRDMHLK